MPVSKQSINIFHGLTKGTAKAGNAINAVFRLLTDSQTLPITRFPISGYQWRRVC